jgi:hypothetical protein
MFGDTSATTMAVAAIRQFVVKVANGMTSWVDVTTGLAATARWRSSARSSPGKT